MPDDFDLVPDGATRLVGDLAAMPDHPIGPHLELEALSGLVTSSLGASDEAEALAHIASCASCAAQAARALEGVLAAQKETQRAVLRLMAVVAVTTAVHRGIVARRRLTTRGTDWKTMSPEGFSCALLERPAGVAAFAIRSSTGECAEVPLQCVIRDAQSGRSWAETWVVLHDAGAEAGAACEATAPLAATLPLPEDWSAEVSRCEFDPVRPPTAADVAPLRQAIAVAPARDLDAWRRWLDGEVENGRLPDALRRALIPRIS